MKCVCVCCVCVGEGTAGYWGGTNPLKKGHCKDGTSSSLKVTSYNYTQVHLRPKLSEYNGQLSTKVKSLTFNSVPIKLYGIVRWSYIELPDELIPVLQGSHHMILVLHVHKPITSRQSSA